MKKVNLLKIVLGLSALEGLLALIWLVSIESDPKNALLFGLSLQRIAMAVAIFLGIMILTWLLIRMGKVEVWGGTMIGRVQKFLSRPWVFTTVLIILGLVSAVGIYIWLLFLNDLFDEIWLTRLSRLMPIIVWLIFLNVQALVILPFLRDPNPQLKFSFRFEKGVWRASLITLWILGCVIIFVAVTRIGLTPIGDWETIGVPLSLPQVAVAVFIALGCLAIVGLLGQVFRRWLAGTWKDILLAVVIWVTAILTWQAVPMKDTFNTPHPSPPNYEYYPHSGAAWQDVVAQNLILGEGYKPDNENEKPFYAFLLAGLHVLRGQDYLQVVNLQIVFTALFPVVLFIFGRLSFNRLTGILLAILGILRERNALTLMNQFDISHSKLLLTDMPGTVLLAAFVLISFVWLYKFPRHRLMAFLSGSLLGLSMLVRNQSVVLLLVAGVTSFLVLRREWKKAAGGMIIFSLGLLLTIAPWLWRNYQVTGRFFTVLPDKGWAIVQRFRMDSGLTPQFDDLSTFEEGLDRLIDFSLEHPVEMTKFLTAHYLHNEISTILVLPTSVSSCCTITSYVEDVPYWGRWAGEILSESLLPIFGNIILISIGLGVSWKKDRVVGLYPLFLHLIYNLSSIVWGISGWRFILPVDWIGIYYYCVGLAYIAGMIYSSYTGKVSRMIGEEASSEKSSPILPKYTWVVAVIVLGVGLLIPIAESLFPHRYTPLTKSEAVTILEENLAEMDVGSDISPEALLDDPTIEAYLGRGLYPRYYRAGKGEPGTPYRWPAHTTRDYNRLGFYLAGPDNLAVVLPLDESPQFFPNAQDVLVFGCRVENYLVGQVVMILDSSRVVYQSPTRCSAVE